MGGIVDVQDGSRNLGHYQIYAFDQKPAGSDKSNEWFEKAETPEAGGYGEALIGTGSYIYAARCLYASSTPYFWRYNPSINNWDLMNTSGLPTGAFRNGAALTWDYGDYIHALLGGRYSDSNLKFILRNNNPPFHIPFFYLPYHNKLLYIYFYIFAVIKTLHHLGLSTCWELLLSTLQTLCVINASF